MYSVLLFLVSPLVSLAMACRDLDKTQTRIIIIGFISYFAMSIDLKILVGEPDLVRYVAEFKNLGNLGILKPNMIKYVFLDNDKPDFLFRLIIYFLTFITQSNRVFLIAIGLIFGFFYSYNIQFVYKNILEKSKFSLFLLFVLSFIIGINELNGFRFWTSSHIVITALLSYTINKKIIRTILLLVVASFLHYSMTIVVLVFLLHLITQHVNIKLLFYAFLCAFFFSQLLESSIAQFLEQFNFGDENMQKQLSGYTSSEYKSKLISSAQLTNWYVAGNEMFLKNTLLFLFIVQVYSNLKDKIQNVSNLKFESLLRIIFIFGIIAFIMATQTSGGRFMIILEYLMLGYFIIVHKGDNVLLSKSKAVIYFILVFVLIIRFRILFDFLGITTLFGGVFIKLFFGDDYTIVNFLKIFIPSF